MKRWLKRNWDQLQRFDYTSLSFLNFACLCSIALIHTLFWGNQYYLKNQESKVLEAIQQIGLQLELVAELDRHENARTGPMGMSPATTNIYNAMAARHAHLTHLGNWLKSQCQQRPCADLFDLDYDLHAHKNDYGLVLKDGLSLAFETIHIRNKISLSFDYFAYISLLALFVVQAIYVFRPAIRRLNASLTTRSDFLSRVSHEVRNPMNSIIGMADILKSTRLNYEQQQYIDNLIRSGHALLDMLNNLIDFSVIEGGKLKIKPSPFNLFQSVDRCLNLIAVQAHHKNLNLYVMVDPQISPKLIGDSVRLEQVLINLLNNACKFTGQGHVSLHIDVAAEQPETITLTFTVLDTGIGIKKEQLSEVFESFVQGDSSIKRKYGGSGLGLSISSEIIKLMNGELEVTSNYGKGSQFYFSVLLQKQTNNLLIPAPRPLLRLQERQFVVMVAGPEMELYQMYMARLGCEASILQYIHDLRTTLSQIDIRKDYQVLIDDSVGIISMINCRNVVEEHGLGDRSIALLRSDFTKENMDLLKRNGFNRFLIKPLKPWELCQLPLSTPEEFNKSTPAGPRLSLVDKLKEKNLRVLLVDDSNDNLFLLREVVRPLASTVHFAENGLEAIEKFRNNVYDVVFMDIQMPVMDGYTAIREIRQLEHTTHRSVPVYAVTAHAGLVDAERCRDAGFTDRIVKPVVRTDIYKSLSKAFALEMGDPEPEMESSLPPDYLTKLIPTYLKTRQEDMAKLKIAIEKQDFSRIQQLGHKVKGSALSYGFPQVSELSQQLEIAAREPDLIRCRQIVDELDAIFCDKKTPPCDRLQI